MDNLAKPGPFNLQRYSVMLSCGLITKVVLITSRAEVYGRENFTFQPGTLIIGNHQSMIDSFLVGTALYLPKAWKLKYFNSLPYHAAAQENFFKNYFLKWLCTNCNCLPVKPGRNSPDILYKISELLKNGKTVFVFPEGGRTRDPNGEFRPAAAAIGQLIYRVKCPVVPVSIWGANHLLPIGSHVPHFGQKLKIAIGRPVNFGELLKQKYSAKLAQQIIDTGMLEVKKIFVELSK
ncbi:MAG: lysophospholipid acyltransferase family protein [Candidatus Buchananbacteria bacterium]